MARFTKNPACLQKAGKSSFWYLINLPRMLYPMDFGIIPASFMSTTALSCLSVPVCRSRVYRILPQQPTGSVFLRAGPAVPAAGSAQSWHGVWCLLGPECQLGPQYSGQLGGRSSNVNINITLKYAWWARSCSRVCGELLLTFGHWIRRWTCPPPPLFLAWPWVPAGPF